MTDSSSNQRSGISRDQWNKPKFSAPSRQKQEAAKLEETKRQVQADVSAADDPKVKEKVKRNRPKVQATIEKGKEWAGKFFKAFIEKERSNVKVDIQHGIVSRVTEQHSERLLSYSEAMLPSRPDRHELGNKFEGIVSIGLAVKLAKSAPSNDLNKIRHLFSLISPELRLPKKVIVLLDQLGKSDISNDFRLRIRDQHLAVKKYLLQGVVRYYHHEESKGRQLVNWKKDYTDIVDIIQDEDKFDRLFDVHSLDVVKTKARDFFKNLSARKNYEFTIGGNTIIVRIPDFEYSEETSAQDVVKYLANPLFKDLQPGDTGVAPLVASLVVQTAQLSWLKKKDKTLAELNSQYKGTFLAGTPFGILLTWLGMIDLSDLIEDEDLDDAASEAIRTWASHYVPDFQQIFEMDQANFNDHGSSAQMVQIDKSSYKKKENGWGDEAKYMVKRPNATTKIKIAEHDAMLGVMISYTKNLILSTGHEISYDSNIRNMLAEFAKSDFKA